MTDVVTFSKALPDTTSWRIVRLALDDALCVCELADILEMPQSSVSSHVQIIRKAGLLESERCEKWTYFRIAPRFRELVVTLARELGDEADDGRKADQAKAAQRLARREQSCCPGPKALVSRVSNPVTP